VSQSSPQARSTAQTAPGQRLAAGPVAPTDAAWSRLRPVPFGSVRITGGLFGERQRANREAAIPSGRERLESAGNLDNLRIAAG
jgi:uncharacterized protein